MYRQQSYQHAHNSPLEHLVQLICQESRDQGLVVGLGVHVVRLMSGPKKEIHTHSLPG